MRPDRFGPPRLGASVITRRRLLDVVAARFEARLMVVEGAAGFGKTTLLAQAAAENARSEVGLDVWITCDERDAAAPVLAADLAAALGEPRGDADASAIADLVWGHSPVPVALVFDDVHLVPDGSAGAGLLEALLTELPENGHVVLVGRPPLPIAVTRLLAQGRAVRVDEDRLRLTPDELRIVAEEHGLAADALDASAGWPALAGLGAAAGPDAARRFVMEEVLGGLPPAARSSLAALCLLDGGDAEMVSPGLGRPVDLARELESLPLVARHGDGWYRPHALWHPITAGVLDDATARAVRRGAACALRARSDLARAGELVLTGPLDDEDWDVVRDLAARTCQIGSWVHHSGAVATWVHRIPPERRAEPAGLLLLAAAERHRGGDAAATASFEAALTAARAAGDVSVELAALSQLGHLAWWRDDLAAGAAVCARAEELVAEGWEEAEPIARFGRAMLAEMQGDPAAVRRAAAGIDRGALSDLLAAAADWLEARALIQLGRAAEAVPLAEQACARAEFPAARTALVVALHQTGRIEEAEREAGRLDPTTAASARDRVLFAIVLASGNARIGRVDDARRAEAIVTAELDAVAGARVGVMAALASAVIEVAAGDEEAAAQRAQAALPGTDDPAVLLPLVVFLAVVYVLVPDSRPTWDAMALGPDHRDARDIVRSLVAARAGLSVAPTPPAPARVLAALGLAWSVELAARTADANLADSCMRLAPEATRSALARLADAPETGAAARRLLRDVPSPPPGPVVVRFLGPATIERNGRTVDDPDWRRERVRNLLGLLLVGTRTTRGEVAAELWPDLDAESALGNLRVTLRYLHRVLEPDRDPGAAPWFVRSHGDVVEIVPELLVVDTREMERCLDAAAAADRDGRAGDALALLQQGLDWWRGDFAADLYDEWATAERERLRARFLAGAVRAGELLLGRGDLDAALELGTRSLAAEAWSESAYRLVAAAHLARGDRASALRALERCDRMLDELGVGREPETAMLWRRLTTAAPDGYVADSSSASTS